MEMLSRERQYIQNLIERLQMASTHLTVPAYDSRGIQMVKNDIDFVADELQDLVNGAWAVAEEFEMETLSVIETPAPQPECTEHDKAYAGWILCSNPPRTQWICRKCKKTGTDVGSYSSMDGEDYRKLLHETIDKIKGGK